MTSESGLFLKCPKCGCNLFTEFATEETSQNGVKLTNTGDRDYENAGEVKIVGDYIEVTGYACQGCGTKYKFSEGALSEAREEEPEPTTPFRKDINEQKTI